MALEGGRQAQSQLLFLLLKLGLGINSSLAATLNIKFQLLAIVIKAITEKDHLYCILKKQKQYNIYNC